MHSFDFIPYITKFNEFLIIRDLTKNTRDSYNCFLKCYLSWIDQNLRLPPEKVSFSQIRSYILYLKEVKKLSNRSINAYISQIRFLGYTNVGKSSERGSKDAFPIVHGTITNSDIQEVKVRLKDNEFKNAIIVETQLGRLWYLFLEEQINYTPEVIGIDDSGEIIYSIGF